MADVLPSDELVDEPSDYGSLQPGHKLGRYELLVPIARGGMARVWAARLHGQRGFQKLVAIKTILPHLADEPEFERMFLDEARIASGVHHPNVCEIYELGEEKKTLYLAMEWVSGDSLARVLRASGKTEGLDARVVARVIADACAGLHSAHELTDDNGRSLGVVHRDLSPHNILLTADGTAKVADFGVAKALGQLHEATSAGQLKGKIAYMAPEQVTGNQIDRRSDVFSLGCVLYEATTGQRPFRGDGDHQVMHAVLKGEFPPPSSLLRGYPQELERIVLRALSQQPILRYPTAERMRFALEEFIARGQLVTQTNVAQVVRARIGEQIDRRKERIRQASTAGDREGGWSEPPGNMTPSNQAQGGHRSGVKQSGQHLAGSAKPLYTTMQMDRRDVAAGRSGSGAPPLSVAPLTPPMAGMLEGPASSTTIPQAPPHYASARQGSQGGGHTPVSHPGAAYSQPGAAYSQPHQLAHQVAHQVGHPQDSVSTGPPPPVSHPFAQTALMPPMVSMPPVVAEAAPGYTPPPPPAMQPPMQQQRPMHSQGPLAFPQSSPYDQSSQPPIPPPMGDGVPPNAPAGTGQYVVAAGVGILLAVLIGVGGFFAWRTRHAPSHAEPTPVAVTATTAPSAGQGASGGSALTPVSVDIVFRIVPSEASIAVEGRELAPDVRTIPRPAMGKTVTVVAHAKGFEDTTILVDFFTTSPMELALKTVGAPAASVSQAVAEPTPPTGEDPRPDPRPDIKDPKDPPKKEPVKRQSTSSSGALPANPY